MKILIADDHAMTRSGVGAALSEMFPSAEIVECSDSEAVIKATKAKSFTLAIVDLFMPGSDSFGSLKRLCRTHPELPVVVLSASENSKHIRKAIDIGVSGYIHKSSDFETMHRAIKQVLNGDIYWPENLLHAGHQLTSLTPDIESPQNREAIFDSLTKRQLEVLASLAKGMSNKAIAENLSISEHTVKSHLKALLAELNCQNRTEVVVLAEKIGLLEH